MPIYEFACPKCRVIFSFFSQRIKPAHLPHCPRCGTAKMERQLSTFAFNKGAKEPGSDAGSDSMDGMPDMDDPKISRVMEEMERDMAGLDENNPRHLAHMMRKMKDIMPEGATPKELETAIKRLEAGEDPEKIEADMGDVLGRDSMDAPAGMEPAADGKTKPKLRTRSKAKVKMPFRKDPKLYDY